MQISELVERTGVPLATVKFYIREGMLAPGRAISARRAEYDETHLHRVELIRSLTTVVGLPLHQAKRILDVIDEPGTGMFAKLGTAIDALAGGPRPAVDGEGEFASAALVSLGSAYSASDDRMEAFAQLDEALRAADRAGFPIDGDRLRLYGEHVMAMARAEVAAMPSDPGAAIEYAVLGTALAEPILAAIRRLAHQNLSVGLGSTTE